MSRDYSISDLLLDCGTYALSKIFAGLKWIWSVTFGKLLDYLVDDGKF